MQIVFLYMRPTNVHEHKENPAVASAVCANKPGSSRRQQGAIILRLRSAVRGCRRDAIGLFGDMPILAMHMRISHRFPILEVADHTQDIEL